MLSDQVIQIKVLTEREETLYLMELKTTERIEILKTIRLRISILKQQLSTLDCTTVVPGLPSMLLYVSICPN
jgi:hypothetical protein